MQERLDPLSDELRRRDREILAAAESRRFGDSSSHLQLAKGESKRAARIRHAAELEAKSTVVDEATARLEEEAAQRWREVEQLRRRRRAVAAETRALRRQQREIETSTERIRAETREIEARTERIRRNERIWDDLTGSEKAVRIILGIGIIPPFVLFIVGVFAFVAAMVTQIDALGGAAGLCLGVAGIWLLVVGGICSPLAWLVHISTKEQ